MTSRTVWANWTLTGDWATTTSSFHSLNTSPDGLPQR